MKCTTKTMTYGGRRLRAGDTFSASSENDARVLVAVKKAERYQPPVPAPIPAVEIVDRALSARQPKRKALESSTDESAVEAAKPVKRPYQRRDMTAEE